VGKAKARPLKGVHKMTALYRLLNKGSGGVAEGFGPIINSSQYSLRPAGGETRREREKKIGVLADLRLNASFEGNQAISSESGGARRGGNHRILRIFGPKPDLPRGGGT